MNKKIIQVLSLILFSFLSFSCSFSIKEEEKNITSLSFSKKCLEMNKGEVKDVRVLIEGNGKTDAKVSYSLSNENVVRLSDTSSSGVVITALNSGSVIVIAQCDGLTSYLEVKVSEENIDTEPYIVLPYVTLEMNKGSRKSIIASLYGGSEIDNALFSFSNDNSSISIESSANTCVIQALKEGVSRITVKHPKSLIDTSFIVVVKGNENNDNFYLTTKSNVIKAYTDKEWEKVIINIVGGDENDKKDISYSVIEGRENIKISYQNDILNVKALKSGNGKIKVSHKKAKEDLIISVISSSSIGEAYIESDKDFFLLNIGETVQGTCSLINSKDTSSSFSYDVTVPGIIEVKMTGSSFFIKAINYGKAKLVIKNDKCSFNKEILIIVEDSIYKSNESYIEVSNPLIDLEKNGEVKTVDISLIGGNESDKNNFSFTVEDKNVCEVSLTPFSLSRGIVIEKPSVLKIPLYIKPLNIGVTKVNIYNTKTNNSASIIVRVYAENTFSDNLFSIKLKPYYKVLKDDILDITPVLSKEINDNTLNFSLSNPNVCDFSSSTSSSCVIKAISKGVCELTVDSDNAITPSSSLIIVGENNEELNQNNIIYTDNSYPLISKDELAFISLKTLLPVSQLNYKLSVSESSIVEAYISGDTLCLKGLQEGKAIVSITNSEIKGFTKSIYVTVKDTSLSLSYPYSIETQAFCEVGRGKSKTLNLLLKGAPLSEYNNLIITSSDNNVVTSRIKNGKLLINGVNRGKAIISLKHEKVLKECFIYIYVSENEEENNVLLFTDKDNYILKNNNCALLSVFSNKEEELNNLTWSVSDTSIIFLDVLDNGKALIKTLKEGLCVITVKHKNGSTLSFYITVKDTLCDTLHNSLSFPSIIELITNKSFILKNSSQIDSSLLNETVYTSNSPLIKVWGENGVCYVMCTAPVSGFITVSNKAIGYKKNIVVLGKDSKEEFNNSYTFNTLDSFYSLNVNEEKDIPFTFGKNNPPVDILSSFSYECDNNSICDISFSSKAIKIKGLNEGKCIITISNPYFSNKVKLNVVITNEEIESPYKYVIKDIVRFDKGSVIDVPYKLINTRTNTDESVLSDTVISLSNNIATPLLLSSLIRIEGKEKGVCSLTLYSKRFNISKTISLIVEDESFKPKNIITSDKDHYLCNVLDEIDISLKSEDPKSNINIFSSDKEIIDVKNIDGLNFTVACKNIGNAYINCESEGYIYKIYFSVTDYSFNNQNKESGYKGESIINIAYGSSYTTKVFSSDSVYLYSYDKDKLDVSLFDNDVLITPKKSGVSYIYYGKEGEYASLINVYDNDNIKPSFNIYKRVYKIKKGESVHITPYTYPFKSVGCYNYKERFGRDIVSYNFDKNSGQLVVTGKTEGYTSITVNDLFSLYFLVSEENNGEISSNTNNYIYSDTSVLFLDKDEEKNIVVNATSIDVPLHSYTFTSSNPSLFSVTQNLNSINVKALKDKGKGYITCSNLLASNTLTFNIIVGKDYIEKECKESYLTTSSSTVSLTFNGDEKIVRIKGMNKNYDPSSFSYVLNNKNIVDVKSEIVNDELILHLFPKTVGQGVITVSHPLFSDNISINYIVEEDSNKNLIYLSTSDNVKTIKKGCYESLKAILIGFNECDKDKYKWSVEDNSIISLFGEGNEVSLFGIKEGETIVTLSHPKSYNTLSFIVKVTEDKTTVPYITTSKNIIEKYENDQIDSFSVSLIGKESSDFSFACENESIVHITFRDNVCYYKPLKEGQTRIKVTSQSAIPLYVNVIVKKRIEDNGYFSFDNNIIYLSPYGKTIKVKAIENNIKDYDPTLIKWFIYSEELYGNQEGHVIDITYNKDTCVIKPLNEGIAKVRLTYKGEESQNNLIIYVTKNENISFTDSSLTLYKGETLFTTLKTPPFIKDITYTVTNPLICAASGNEKVCAVRALNEGNAIIKAQCNNFSCELIVNVIDKNETDKVLLNVSKSFLEINPRQKDIYISSLLIGKDVREEDQDNIQWSVSGNESIKLYPSKGREVLVTLEEKDGKIIEGDATISVTSPLLPSSYKKNIYVKVKECDNYFTLSSYALNLETDKTTTLKASLLGGSEKDKENILWTINKDVNEKEEVARLLNTTGDECTILGLKEGNCEIQSFYNGAVQTCNLHVYGERYFSLVTDNITLFPGTEYALQYNLRPLTSIPSWYTSSDIIDIRCDEEEQKLYIKAKETGLATVTGIVNGVGTALLNVKCVYDPTLTDLSKTAGSVFIPLREDLSSSKTLKFKCYPESFYVKAYVESKRGMEDKVLVSVKENHSGGNGEGSITITSLGELPNDDICVILKQYEDKECTKEVKGNELRYKVNSYYIDKYGKKDSGFSLFFKRYDGSFTLRQQNPNSGTEIKLFSSDKAYINSKGNYETQKIDFGESESHYLIFRPRHKGQYIKDLKISVKSDVITCDSSVSSSTTDIRLTASPFNSKDETYVSVINTGKNCDVAYDVYYDKNKNEICLPSISSNEFYPRFAVRKPLWNGKTFSNVDEYYPGEVNKSYEKGNYIKWDNNKLVTGPSDALGPQFSDQNWTETLFCLKDSSSLFYLNEKAFTEDNDSLISSKSIPLCAYILEPSIKEAFYKGGNYNFTIHNGKKDSGVCRGESRKHWGYHYYWLNSKSSKKVNVTFEDKYTVYTKDNFPYSFKAFDMWKNKEWINSGMAYSLPNTNTSPIKKINCHITISYTDIDGKVVVLEIPGTITLYDCFRRFYKYDSSNTFTGEIDDTSHSLKL